MDAMVRMDRSVDTVVHDLGIVLQRIRQLRKEVGSLDSKKYGEARLLRMAELIADMQARTEGIEVFVQACRKQAHRIDESSKDVDLWM